MYVNYCVCAENSQNNRIDRILLFYKTIVTRNSNYD